MNLLFSLESSSRSHKRRFIVSALFLFILSTFFPPGVLFFMSKNLQWKKNNNNRKPKFFTAFHVYDYDIGGWLGNNRGAAGSGSFGSNDDKNCLLLPLAPRRTAEKSGKGKQEQHAAQMCPRVLFSPDPTRGTRRRRRRRRTAWRRRNT